MVSMLALVTEEGPDTPASDKGTNYNGQIVDEFSGEEAEELDVALEDPSTSESNANIERKWQTLC